MTKKEHFKMMYDRLTPIKYGVHLNKVLCSALMYLAGGRLDVFGNLKSILKFFTAFDLSDLESANIGKKLIVFGSYPSRNDHRELIEGIANRIGEDVTYIDMSKWSTKKIKISCPNIFLGLREGYWKMRGHNLSLKVRLLLAAHISFYLNTLDTLSKIDFSSTRKFLCLANSLDLDNLFTQFLQTKGIKTYSLMEGAYFVQDSDLPITNIAFENLTSDIQLCWGQYSKDQFIKYGYSPEKMIVAGYPKKVEGVPMKSNNPYKKCVVLLSQYIMEDQNLALIDILANNSKEIEFHLKLHPSLDFTKYSRVAEERGLKIVPKEVTVNQCVDNNTFDFAIAINSTAYYEALMRGVPCLRYFDGSYTPLAGYDDEFSNLITFMWKLNKIRNLEPQVYQNEINRTLEYTIGLGIDEYKNIMS